jgi:pilus assembly protein CpaF
MGHVNLPMRAIRTQIVGALDLIVHVERMRDGVRRLVQLAEVCGVEGDVITTNDHANFEYQRDDAQGRIVGRYSTSKMRPGFASRLEYYGLDVAWSKAAREL